MARPPKHGFFRWYVSLLAVQIVILAGLLQAIPGLWAQQVQTLDRVIPVIIVAHAGLCFFEWFFHRYVLHMVVWRVLHQMYEAHTNHHYLTRIELKSLAVGSGRRILNKYPITEDHQLEDAAFPEYAYLGFALVFTPLFAFVQWLLPSWPIMFGGYAAVAWSLTLYEVLHHLEHKPYEWWQRRTEESRFRGVWRRVYGFHHMHHANIRCNEAISGFFGLPLADWMFGTYFQPRNLLLHDRMATADDFKINPPRRWVVMLDKWARKRSSRNVRAYDQAA